MTKQTMARALRGRRWTCRCVVAVAVAMSGCGGSGPAPIEAKFLIDGEPLKQASITFVRQDGGGGRAAFGVTDGDGVATLTTYQPNDGVLPGKYRVVVIKAPEIPGAYVEVDTEMATDPENSAALSSGMFAGSTPRRRRVRSVLPDVYTDPGTTPLTCTVSHDQREHTFEVSSEL